MRVRLRTAFFACGTALGLVLASVSLANSESEPEPEAGAVRDDGEEAEEELEEPRERTVSATPDTVTAQLAEAREPVDSIFGTGPLKPLDDLWNVSTEWVRDETGLSLGLNYTFFFQHATRARGANQGVLGDLDVLGRWDLIDFDGSWPGALAFQTEWRHRMTSSSPGQLRSAVGSQWATAVSTSSQRYAAVELYWEQGSYEDGLIARVGKMDPALIYDGGRYVSQNLAFLSGAFSDSPAMSFTAPGLGVGAAVYPNDWFYVMGGVHDANSQRTQVGFNSIDNTDFWYAGEIGINFRYGTKHEGLYHLTAWHSEKASKVGRPSGEGFQLHAEQQLGKDGEFVPFIRYGWAKGGITDTRQLLAVGMGYERPFARRNDLVGLAFAWGDAKRRDARDQYTIEAFYRVRVTPLLSLTPDAQVILDPSTDKKRDTIWIFSLRARTVF